MATIIGLIGGLDPTTGHGGWLAAGGGTTLTVVNRPPPPTLESIIVFRRADQPTINVSQTQQFTATGHYSDGSSRT